jgi:hypothetical protein
MQVPHVEAELAFACARAVMEKEKEKNRGGGHHLSNFSTRSENEQRDKEGGGGAGGAEDNEVCGGGRRGEGGHAPGGELGACGRSEIRSAAAEAGGRERGGSPSGGRGKGGEDARAREWVFLATTSDDVRVKARQVLR